MEPKMRWDGYVSFSYLEAGIDYKEFELLPQIGRVDRLERAARVARGLGLGQ